MMVDRHELEKIVGTHIRDISLYQCAFTHKSALRQYSHLSTSYETLEFLGDSVLGFIITKIIYDAYPSAQEGFLTKLRTQLVRGRNLAQLSLKLGLYKFIVMDEKAMRNRWYMNQNILEDVFEAFIGAMYLDLGIIHVRQFVVALFDIHMFEDDNYKDIVMRHCQALRYQLPEYRVRSFDGGVFTIDLYIEGLYQSSGCAQTKKEAEQMAASVVVKHHNLQQCNAPARGSSYTSAVCEPGVDGVALPPDHHAHRE